MVQIIPTSIRDIKPYDKNPRKNDASVDRVAESIKAFGFKVPIVIDKDNIIVTGHTRYKAAKKLGIDNVPCIRADDLTDEQIKAYRLADNKVGESSEWDIDLLSEELDGIFNIDMDIFGFGDEEEEEPDEEEIVEDEYDVSLNEEPHSKTGQLYKLGRHFLMVGDSTDPETITRLMQGQQADLLVTDPPYGVDYVSNVKRTWSKEAQRKNDIKNDKLDEDSLREFLVKAFRAIDNVLKPGGAYYIWHAFTRIFDEACVEVGWQTRQTLIWNKDHILLGRQDYQNKHEACLYGWKAGAAHYFVDDRTNRTVIDDIKPLDIKKMKKEELQKLLEEILSDKVSTTVIDVPKPIKSELHPTMKPIKLIAHLIRNSSRQGEKVLDPFGGSGTTLIAAEQLGRTAYISEYDPKYADVIIERYESFTGQKAELISEFTQ